MAVSKIIQLLECNSEGQLISTGPSSSTDAYDIARNYEIGTRTIDFSFLTVFENGTMMNDISFGVHKSEHQ
jgi:hypothetical protein